MEQTVTKRLHISGLTPSISHQDLTQRLSTFGNVKTLDGIGALDAVGRPKKFAYATLEATPAKLARCLNTLSGSTWKGTKLRIGEAKPDFRERIQAENTKHDEDSELRRKRARLRYARYQAIHAKDMSPVTLETARIKGGWVVTPLGRIYRPLKMRPPRPLPLLASTTLPAPKKDLKGKGKEVKGKAPLKQRKRLKKPDVRARRRKIDMMKYGSVYLKGRFLEADVPAGVGDSGLWKEVSLPPEMDSDGDETDEEITDTRPRGAEEENEEEEMGEESEVPAEASEDDVEEPVSSVSTHPKVSPPLQLPTEPKPAMVIPHVPTSGVNFQQETQASLGLLASLFGTSGVSDEVEDDNWIGREDLDSDIDEADLAKARAPPQSGQKDAVDFEIVPRDRSKKTVSSKAKEDKHQVIEDVEMETVEAEAEVEEEVLPEKEAPPASQPAVASTKLKDLFAPSENEGGFSLLGHLNLEDDLELDEEVPFSITEPTTDLPTMEAAVAEPQTITVPTTSTSGAKSDSRRVSQITLDPSQPLFFPLSLLATHPAAADAPWLTNPDAKNRPKDMFDTLKAKRWDWPSSGFYRTQTEDEIRQEWEERKGELTQGWKKRWREAGRLGRRRGKVGPGEEG